jgi:hypothetical protein
MPHSAAVVAGLATSSGVTLAMSTGPERRLSEQVASKPALQCFVERRRSAGVAAVFIVPSAMA